MIEHTEKFIYITATGWTALGSIVSAISILALSVFNWLYLVAARRAAIAAEKSAVASEQQAGAAQKSLQLLRDQLALTERPFVAFHSEYCEAIGARLVYAHNQGNGPALDVQASLVYGPDNHQADYGIGCLPVDGKFQFLIGDQSLELIRAVVWYRSITGGEWTTTANMIGGHSIETIVANGFPYKDAKHQEGVPLPV